MSKSRGRNFTPKEKELLVSLIEDHPRSELTTNRNNDKDTCKAKKKFWCEIAESFNSASGSESNYNDEQLKICFKNMASRAKNAQAENKKETIKTGGGQKESEIGTIDAKVINVIGDTIKPIDNLFDSDAKFFSQPEVFNINDGDSSQHSLAEKTQSFKKKKYVSNDEKTVFIEKIELEKLVLSQTLINLKKKEKLLDLKIRKLQDEFGPAYDEVPSVIETTFVDLAPN